MRYETDEEIHAVVESFENCTVKRDEWGHPEHLIVAYHYALDNDFQTAYKKMKAGIFKLLDTFGVDLLNTMPYHETLTIFWLKTIFSFARENPEISVESTDEMIKRFDKHYPGRFYSHECLFSERARSEYVEPDLPREIEDLRLKFDD